MVQHYLTSFSQLTLDKHKRGQMLCYLEGNFLSYRFIFVDGPVVAHA